MKNNAELQKDVQDAIRWEPLLNAAEIGVTVKDGIVTLTGVVDSFSKKSEAEDAAKYVKGVKAVVEKIEVKFSSLYGRQDDNEIADAVVNAFKWNWRIPNDKIKVQVEKGRITLDGQLEWAYQRDAAKDAVKNLLGVNDVINNIIIRSEIGAASEKTAIEEALKRNWSIYSDDIVVSVEGHTVTLKGIVDSWYKKNEAGRVALNAPGIWAVDNELVVDYEYATIYE